MTKRSCFGCSRHYLSLNLKNAKGILDGTQELEVLDETRFSVKCLDITIVPKEEFEDFLGEAELISPDPDDVTYFALALRTGCSIWSQDKKLKEQDRIKVYNTEEIIRQLA